jgi:DNA-binding HxlR family transcriptional regulator
MMPTRPECKSAHRAVRDTLEVLSGKWKLVILTALMEHKMRFRELSRELKISPRILSKELQELEMNRLVKRTVCDTRPITVEYEVTDHSRTLHEVVQAMRTWGILHHDTIIGKRSPDAAVVDPAP